MFQGMSSENATSEGVRARGGVERRTVLKGAAWSVPVIAAAVAAPSATASLNNAGLQWTSNVTSLLALQVLDSQTVLTAGVLVTVPTMISLTNGAGALSGAATVSITVGRPSGINIPVGRAHGFGVYQYDGATTTSGQRSATYQSAFGLRYGFPTTTFTTTRTFNVASGATLNTPVVWGLAGDSTGVSVSALASFPVSVSIVFPNRTLQASSSIIVPVGAGIL